MYMQKHVLGVGQGLYGRRIVLPLDCHQRAISRVLGYVVGKVDLG